MPYRLHVLLTVGLLALISFRPAHGRQVESAPRDSIPAISAAEILFNEGVRAYADGKYDLARGRFLAVVEEYPFNRRTTSALLMAGNTLFQLENYEAARELYTRLIENYPASRYVSEAERALGLMEEQDDEQEERPEVIHLGIALPLTGGNRAYTQALFNGIRMAVEQFNAGSSEPKIQMIFRNSGGQPELAREAVRTLIRQDSVDVIIGPLYSTSEVIPAAGVAERHEVPLIAPMATEESVTRNREYVFQINPPLSVRGRLLARYVAEETAHNRIGIVAELGSAGERMARSFQTEILKRGLEVEFFQLLTSGNGWYRLPTKFNPDTLQSVDALFIPITGDRAVSEVEAALGSLARMLQYPQVQVFANSAWRNVRPTYRAEEFEVVFGDSFWAGPSSADSSGFERRYARLAGEPPNRLAYVGYDVTRFLADELENQLSSTGLAAAIRQSEPYQGEGIRIDFEGGQINHGLYFLGFQDGSLMLVE